MNNGSRNFFWQERNMVKLGRDLDGWIERMHAEIHELPIPVEKTRQEEGEDSGIMTPTFQNSEGSRIWSFV